MNNRLLGMLIAILVTSLSSNALAQTIHLDCKYTEAASGVGPYPVKVSIDLDRGTVEQQGTVYSGRNVTISPTIVSFRERSESYQISRKDLSYTRIWLDTLFVGKCEVGQAPETAF